MSSKRGIKPQGVGISKNGVVWVHPTIRGEPPCKDGSSPATKMGGGTGGRAVLWTPLGCLGHPFFGVAC